MKRILSLLLTLGALALLTVSGATAQTGRGPAGDSASRGDSNTPALLRAAVAEQGALSVIVVLNVEQAGRMAFDDLSDDSKRGVIASAQDTLLGELGLGVFSTDAVRAESGVLRYENFPMLALSVDAAQLETVLGSSSVAAIQRDEFRAPSLLQTTAIIGMTGANGAWAQGADGHGQTVAIIDSGVQSSHPQLPLKVVSEACYGVTTSGTYNGAAFNSTPACPGGVNSTAAGSGVPCSLIGVNIANKNQCDHGTNVAGVVAAKTSASINGVAKESTLIAIQVFSMINTPSATAGQGCDNIGTPATVETQCILAADSSILAGLDRVFALRTSLSIAAANLSLGSQIYSTQSACDAALPAYVTAVNQVTGAGIAVVASSGNEGRTDGINAPACITGIISVGATDDIDAIYVQSNASPFLSYMAPGVNVDTTDTGGVGDNVTGTSFSAPHVAGAIAALRSYQPDATLTDIKTALTNTGVNISEVVGGITRTYKRIQVDAAVNTFIRPSKPALLTPAINASFAATPITFEWTTGNNTDSYRLIITRPDSTRIVEQDIAHGACDLPNSKCSLVVTAAFLDNTTYTWQVSARKANSGTKSDPRTFVFETPGKAELTAPVNNAIFNKPTDLAQLTWVEVDLATDYRVKIVRADNKSIVVLDQTMSEASICAAGVCTLTVPGGAQALLTDNKQYLWFVISSNSGGTSKSNTRKFTAQFPAAPLLMSPIGNALMYAPSTALIWGVVSDASDYKLNIVQISTGRSILKKTLTPGVNLNCTVSECAYSLSAEEQAKLKNNKRYQWWVIARNAFGKTPSLKAIFKTQFPGKPLLQNPVNNVQFTDKTQLVNFVWTPAPGATTQVVTYRIKLFVSNNPSSLLLDVIVTPGIDVACDSSLCSYAVGVATQDKLKFGKDYKWSVQAISAAGKSKSAAFLFKLRQP